jgi:hypothetical protein
MSGRSKRFVIVVAVTFAVASPAFARSTSHPGGVHAVAAAPRSAVTVDRNNPFMDGIVSNLML